MRSHGFCLLLALAFLVPSVALADTTLSEQVLIAEDLVFLAAANDRLVARDVTSGKVAWSSREADGPLTVVGDTLVARGPAKEGFRLLLLNAKTGKVEHRFEALPVPQLSTMKQGIGERKTVDAQMSNGELYVYWSWHVGPKGGVRSLNPTNEHADGRLRLDLAAKTLQPVSEIPTEPTTRSQSPLPGYYPCGPEKFCKFSRATDGVTLQRIDAKGESLAPRSLGAYGEAAWDKANHQFLLIAPKTGSNPVMLLVDTETDARTTFKHHEFIPTFTVVGNRVVMRRDTDVLVWNRTSGKQVWKAKTAAWRYSGPLPPRR